MSLGEKWDRRFLSLAEEVASWSKDPTTQVGAVIVRPDRSVASVGFNGFARGMHDDHGLYEYRPAKLSRIIHAEMNAILTYPDTVKGMICYTWPWQPCDRCAVHLIQAGIVAVVSEDLSSGPTYERWKENLALAQEYFEEAKVSLTIYKKDSE